MNWLKNLFTSAKGFFVKLFSKQLADGIMRVVSVVSPWVVEIYPIVVRVAELTPTRADDEILKLAKKYALKFTKTTPKDFALREIAKAMFKAEIPEGANTQDYILNLAIEMAYAKFKQETTQQPQ
jgi:hypothetical protein